MGVVFPVLPASPQTRIKNQSALSINGLYPYLVTVHQKPRFIEIRHIFPAETSI